MISTTIIKTAAGKVCSEIYIGILGAVESQFRGFISQSKNVNPLNQEKLYNEYEIGQ